jgi:rRNA maturation endonuclease Nob1
VGGPVYICPFCVEETLIWDDFNFCPHCGGNLEGFRFESEEEEKKRLKNENEEKR